FLADVGIDELGLRTKTAQLISQRLAGLIAPTGNDDVRALLGEGDGGGAPDTGKSTCDQDDGVAHGSSPSWCGVGPKMNSPEGLKNGPQFQTYWNNHPQWSVADGQSGIDEGLRSGCGSPKFHRCGTATRPLVVGDRQS